MITKNETAEIVKNFGAKFGKGEKDTGSPAVQVAILTRRIKNLAPHFNSHIHDFHSNRGLLKLIGKRRSLLKYLQRSNETAYTGVIKELGLRK